jgi:DNA ligase (NAD+)
MKYDGWGQVSTQALFASIAARKIIEFDRFLFSLGIESVGTMTARLLAEHYGTYDTFREASRNRTAFQEDLVQLSGIGPQTVAGICAFLECRENRELLDILTGSGLNIAPMNAPSGYVTVLPYKKAIANQATPFLGKMVVFTGKLEYTSRAEAKMLAERLGARVGSAVTHSTDYLIAGESPGSKYAKAVALGIPILTEEEWRKKAKEV